MGVGFFTGGRIAIEGRLRDSTTQAIVMQFADREKDKATIYSARDYMALGHLHPHHPRVGGTIRHLPLQPPAPRQRFVFPDADLGVLNPGVTSSPPCGLPDGRIAEPRDSANVKCGGTAAQDSQSEANEGAYPPLPPTTCSASCPSLVVAEFIRQLEKLRSELSCLLGTHLNRIVMWYSDDFHMDGSTIWRNPTRHPLFVALILRCLIGWHVSLVSAERSSAGTAGAGVSVETGWRVKVTESMADRAAPAVVQPRLVRLWLIRWFVVMRG